MEEEAPLGADTEAIEDDSEVLEGKFRIINCVGRIGGGFKRDRDEYGGGRGGFRGRGGRRRAFSDEGRGRRGDRGRRGGRGRFGGRFRDGGRKKGAEDLDKEMNEYWEKSGDKEHGK